MPPAELEDDVGLTKKDKGGLRGIGGAVRRLSSRVSSGIRSSLRRNGGASSSRAGRTRSSAAIPPVVPEGEQVAVAMSTMNPQDTQTYDCGGCEVQMPHTTTESSPT